MSRIWLRYTLYLLMVIGISNTKAGAYEDFFVAAMNDNGSVMETLLLRGMDPNSRSEQGQTALYLAMREGSFKVADKLLAAPATDIDLANAVGETPLMMAALKGHLAWMQRLIDRGARLELTGWTPLHYAASGAESDAVDLLVRRGARLDARSPNGTTPLMMAARYGSESSVKRLLEAGADPRLRNQQDLDAAGFARQGGRDSLAQSLARAAGR